MVRRDHTRSHPQPHCHACALEGMLHSTAQGCRTSPEQNKTASHASDEKQWPWHQAAMKTTHVHADALMHACSVSIEHLVVPRSGQKGDIYPVLRTSPTTTASTSSCGQCPRRCVQHRSTASPPSSRTEIEQEVERSRRPRGGVLVL